MNPGFLERVDAVDWKEFATAYGKADKVAEQLKKLGSGDRDAAMTASHDLWCGLCHQHAYISSAALPALPLIFEVLDTADEDLAVELLDILTGFTFCSTRGPGGPSPIEWERELRHKLASELPRFERLAQHQNEHVSGFAEMIVENLGRFKA